ncbi:MAG: asparagine synthase (glutamine-hydrolyzing) [Clostridiales bacterium]|nr:asparagine synthase (glutamine-hydrolyzing) [Clostridiales bacterium]
MRGFFGFIPGSEKEGFDASQPLLSEDKTLALIFNGELYNPKELRSALEEKGCALSTGEDAEIVLRLYGEYGHGMLHHLQGMFACAVFDSRTKSLFVARDPFGTKSVYYTRLPGGGLMFGSEIKDFFSVPSFKTELNEQALAEYLTFQYSVLPETFFKGVYKLLPAHFLTFENGELKITRYFTPVFTPSEMTLDAAVSAIDGAVRDSVSKCLAGGGENTGAFLSGGVDSGYLAACASESAAGAGTLKTFTVGFDYEKYNEISYAKSLSEKLGAEHFTKLITTGEYWEHLPVIQRHLDEPLADPAAAAFYFSCREAARQVKVAFSGEGADEFFGGYNIYREPLDLKILTRLPRWLRKFLAFIARCVPFDFKGKNFFIRGAEEVEERFIGNAKIFTEGERAEILRDGVGEGAPGARNVTRPYYDQVKGEDDITKMQFLDLHLWMAGDILYNVEKMSAAHSLTVRMPYLDREVFRVATKLPTGLRVNRTGTKYAFRKAAALHVPRETAERYKLGFPVPIRIWLKEEKYYRQVRGYFENETAGRYFKREALIKLLDGHKKGKRDNSRKIWTVFIFLLWHEQYFEARTREKNEDEAV